MLSGVCQMANYSAVTTNNLFPRMTVPTLITLRLAFYFCTYFLLSVSPLSWHHTVVPLTHFQCFFALLNLAFGTPFGRFYGASGFVIYWMMAWVSMLAL